MRHLYRGGHGDELRQIAVQNASSQVDLEPPPLYSTEPSLTAKVVRLRELDQAMSKSVWNRVCMAEYAEAKILGGSHINKAYVMRDGDTAEVYKPRAGQHKRKERAGISPETQWQREIAAGEIARELGIAILPQTREFIWQGEVGSAQFFQEGMISGSDASLPPYRIPFDKKTSTPENLPDQMAEDWQLLDDLLMHGDRHKRNYLLRLDAERNIMDLALIDNGLSLTADLSVVSKRFKGPKEGMAIGPVNQERLRQFIEQENRMTITLSHWLEPTAIMGLFVRAKVLAARRRYGNFSQAEIDAHLPPELRFKKGCVPPGFKVRE